MTREASHIGHLLPRLPRVNEIKKIIASEVGCWIL